MANPTRRAFLATALGAPVALSTRQAFARTGDECAPGVPVAKLGREAASNVFIDFVDAAATAYGMVGKPDKEVYAAIETRDPVAYKSFSDYVREEGPIEYTFKVKSESMIMAGNAALRGADATGLYGKGAHLSLKADYPLFPEPGRKNASLKIVPNP